MVDFKGIPVAQVEKLAEALVDQLYPVREVTDVVDTSPMLPQPTVAAVMPRVS